MLIVGLPLAIVFGTLAGTFILRDIPFWEVAVLAAILAPTDAALGAAVIENSAVPQRVRRTLAAESGLNDGLVLPIVLFLACLALGGQHDFQQTNWVVFALEQIGIGSVFGAVAGLAGSTLLLRAVAARLCDEDTQGIAVLAVAAIAYLGADAAGGNGFLAAFVGGLAFGARMGGRCHFAGEFLEGEGQLLVLASFLLIGLALLPDALAAVGPADIALILVSLLVVRPLAVWLALVGTDAPPLTRLFLGWFGPRGLATALFALLVIDFAELDHGEELLDLAVVAVAISALLHGATAAPAARRFGARLRRGSGSSRLGVAD
jgi:NhaP-type Na+/H+ or K+/H+ antiporter